MIAGVVKFSSEWLERFKWLLEEKLAKPESLVFEEKENIKNLIKNKIRL